MKISKIKPPVFLKSIIRIIALTVIFFIIMTLSVSAQATGKPVVVAQEMLYEKAPFPSCHASSIASTPSGLVAAFFGGTEEKDPDVGIWVCRNENGKWSSPA